MLVIGLTGGIACGKTTCSQHIVEKGIPVIDADKIAREVVQPGRGSWKLIKKHFGDDVLLPDGNLNRPKLREIISKDETFVASPPILKTFGT